MHIGRAGRPVSHMSQAYPDSVEVRGRDLCGDLKGRLSFTEYFHLAQAQARVADGEAPESVAADVARAIHAAGGKVPGFGHPVHRPLDPRAERILELADERGVGERTAGLLAHLAEEQERPVGFLMAARAEEAIEYEPSEGAG
jgi:citrate synthase